MWRQQLAPLAYSEGLSATTRSLFWLGAPHAPKLPFGWYQVAVACHVGMSTSDTNISQTHRCQRWC